MYSERLKGSKEKKNDIKLLLHEVDKRIVELEDSYLTETSNLGNICRGFDIDGKRIHERDSNAGLTRDKLFSQSSYAVWSDNKALQEGIDLNKTLNKVDQPQVKFENINIHNQKVIVQGMKVNRRNKRSLSTFRKGDPDANQQQGDY